MKVTKETSEAYDWGFKCKGWHLVNTEELSVIQELMPPGTEEVQHQHSKSQQFFFVLNGEATFIVEGKAYKVRQNEGIHIKPNIVHQVKNETEVDLAFIVISQPHAHGDRIIQE